MKKSFYLFIGLLLFGGLILSGCDFGNNNQQPAPIEDDPTALTLTFYDGETLIAKQTYHKGEEISYPTEPAKEGQFFVGWVDDSGHLFELEIMPSTSVVLHTKYEAGYTYYFVDYDGTILKKGNGPVGSTVLEPNAPTRAKEGTTVYTFVGWDKEVTALMDNVTYTAVYESKEVAVLTMHLDGGNFQYRDYDDVTTALLNDYNRFSGKQYTKGSLPTGAYECANFASFYYNGETAKKWSWLVEYLSKVGGVANRPALRALLSCTTLKSLDDANDEYKYCISYELRAFIRGGVIDSNISYVSANYAEYDLQNGFWPYFLKTVSGVVEVDLAKPVTLLNTPYRQNYNFGGWYDNPDFTGDPISTPTIRVTQDMDIYAKWIELTQVEDIVITNGINELEKYASYTLEWNILPSDAGNKRLRFKSSDESVATISAFGGIVALKEGQTTITISSVLTPSVVKTFVLTVYSPNYFVVSYETNAYVSKGETIKLNAELIKRDKSSSSLSWLSLDETIATVNEGIVTGVNSGVATIRCSSTDSSDYFDFFVSVLPENITPELQAIIDANENNVYTEYQLGIGSGTPSYYADIIGSVSKLLFKDYEVDTQFESVQAGVSSNHGGTKSSTEFITVHYTGNMSKTADGRANAQYFATGGNGTSIHYVTGNDGIYHILDNSLVGFHAGDRTDVKYEWRPVGVMWSESDPLYPVWGISSDSYFTINGKKTNYHVPEGSTPSTKCVTDSRWINDMGLAYKVVDGEYYMGTTWWCYTQVSEGRICNKGGNNNSVGIESCVNQGSDLWYTWQLTAQLVAHLMKDFNLDITRVVGHHFYSAKNCPQPMLENNLRLWWEFIDLVEVEYQRITLLANYDITFTVLEGSSALNNGRVRQPKATECIKYQVTIKNKTDNSEQTIVLASVINSVFSK